MEFVVAVARLGVLAFGVTLFLVLLGALTLGALAGIRRREIADQQSEQVSFAVNSMLGLLAFILGLTLVMAQGRYEEVRRTALQEANAIGTAWQWAHAVAHPRATTIAGLLEDYLSVRTAFVSAEVGNPEVIAAIELRSGALHGEIWGHAMVIARETTDQIAVELLASLTGTFDATTQLRWAFSGTVLVEVLLLVLACSVLAIGGIGYQFGVKGLRRPVMVLALIAMHAAATTVTLDLATPRLGSMRADVRPYEWTRDLFRGGVAIPPGATQNSTAPGLALPPASSPPPRIPSGAEVQPRPRAGVSNFSPEYPRASRLQGEEGRVTLLVQVGRDGRVADAAVLGSSGHEALDLAAEAAVRRWQVEPATQQGRPIFSTTTVGIMFRLEQDTSAPQP